MHLIVAADMAPSHPARCPNAFRSATPCPQGRQSTVLPAPCSTRREAHLAATLGLVAALGRPAGAAAVTVEEATPPVAPAGPLSDREEALVSLYARVSPSVVNIYDFTLQGRVQAGPQSVEQPEGNGTGFVYDARGHIVTNAHVLQNVLSGAAGKVQPGSLVARVLLLGAQPPGPPAMSARRVAGGSAPQRGEVRRAGERCGVAETAAAPRAGRP